MKLFLDENLSSVHAAFLREQGHDAISVVEAGLSGKPDEAIREFAIQTERVLRTMDSDFANIARFPPNGTPGVIRLKIHPPTEEAIREQIQRTMALLQNSDLQDCLAVSSHKLIRIRRGI